MKWTDVRVEDVITVAAAGALALTGMRVAGAAEGRWWEYSFVVFPAALLMFAAAVRYAFGGGAVAQALGGIGRIVRDWLPFALFLVFYETLRSRLWLPLAGREKDAALLHIDRILFGETPSVAMQSWISPLLTDVLAVCYFVHLILPPTVAVFWYRRDLVTFRHFLLSIFLCGAIGSALYIAVPAVGPAVAFRDLYTTPIDSTRATEAVAMMDVVGRAPHDVFPSLHIAISAIALYFAARWGRRMFLPLLPLVLGNWISTIYLRYHYAIDDICGLLLAILTIALAGTLLKTEARWHEALAAHSSPVEGA